MAFIRNTDKLVEGSSQLFFSIQRAKSAVQSDLDSLSSGISSEQSARQSADSAMQLRLTVIEGSGAGSIAKAQADAQSYADLKISQLINSAPALLDTLKELADAINDDPNFAATVAGQIGVVDAKVIQEISDRQSAVSGLNLRLQALEADPVTKSYVDSAVNGEASARISADAAEQLARQSADSVLSSRISDLEADPVTKTYVDGQVSGLDSRLDILEQDETTKAYVDSQISSLDSRIDVLEIDPVSKSYVDGEISAEESRAMSAESALDGRLDILEQDPVTKSYVDAHASSEQSSRESAINALDGRLDILESDPVTKSYVDGEMSSEQSARQSADQALDGRLDVLELDPVTKSYVDGIQSSLDGRVDILEQDPTTKSYVDGQISSEQSARQSADSALDSRLDALELDPVTKSYVDGIQSSLDGRLDALELDPVSKSYVDGEVSDLQGQVTTEKGRIDAILSASTADKDSFAEIVSLINSVDASNDSAFAGYVLSNNAALAQEVSDRQSGDNALDARLDVLESDPVTKSYVNSADNLLDGRLDVLETDPTTKTYVDGKVSMLQSADSTLQSNIDGLFASKTTSNLAEGSNLYYTQARFDSAFGAKSTSNLSEGSNLYFTDARAKSASIVNSSAGSQTDQAMSVSAAKSYIDAADNARLKLDGTNVMTGALLAFSGTSTAPGISFSAASNYGIWYNTGSPSVNIIHGGTPKLVTTAGGISVTGTLAVTVSASIPSLTCSGSASMSGVSNANITWANDGSGNIGASGANRPNNIYVKTSVVTPSITIGSLSGVLKASAGVVAGSATTSDLTEGSNLYYTQARFDSAFAGKSSTDLAEGTKLFFTDARAKSAAVVNSSAGSQTDQAMSVSAGKSYADSAVASEASLRSAEDLLMVKLDGSRPVTGELSMQGGMKVKHSEKSVSYTLASSDYIIGVTAVSGGKTMTLPLASSVGVGKVFIIKDQSGLASGSDSITIACSGSNKIDGQSNYVISVPYESVMVVSNGSNWFIV